MSAASYNDENAVKPSFKVAQLIARTGKRHIIAEVLMEFI